MSLFVYQIIVLLLHAAWLRGTHIIAFNPDTLRRKRAGWIWVGVSLIGFMGLGYLHIPKVMGEAIINGIAIGLIAWAGASFFIMIGGAAAIMMIRPKQSYKPRKPAEVYKENLKWNKLLGNIVAIGSPLGLSAVLVFVDTIQTIPAIIATVFWASIGPMLLVRATSKMSGTSSSSTYSSSGVSNSSSYSSSSSSSSSYTSSSDSSSSGSFSGFSGGSFGGGGATGSW